MNARDRIASGLTAFACGDAAGVPWEMKRPEEIDRGQIADLPIRRDWPRGSVSDDTVFLLSVAKVVASANATPRALLEQLAADLPRARGAGRTSRAAIERFKSTGALRAESGATNGAAMRALPIGWAIAPSRTEARITTGIALALATHGAPSAVVAAVAVAAMGTWSVEGEDVGIAIERALPEAMTALDILGAPHVLVAPLQQAADGNWRAPDAGVPFQGIETVAAVISVLRHAESTEDCITRAICLGGDTDTSAAIAAGIFAASTGDDAISWRDKVPLLAELDALQLPQRLARLRDVGSI
jgi:ADP-ribosylglycohydrolase